MQLPYVNRLETIWEYEKLFLSGQIDFCSSIGERCPICGGINCYQAMAPYWRYAIELFPEFKKKRIPIARFLCRQRRKTFSLLPIQLIPYFQYTVGAVVGALLLGTECWQNGQKGFYGASEEVDPESLVAPWLITCWLAAVVRGLRHGHPELRRLYPLDGIGIPEKAAKGWQEATDYFVAFGLKPRRDYDVLLMDLLYGYSWRTDQFLFGTSSQYRGSARP